MGVSPCPDALTTGFYSQGIIARAFMLPMRLCAPDGFDLDVLYDWKNVLGRKP